MENSRGKVSPLNCCNPHINHFCFQPAIKSGRLTDQPPEDNQVVSTMDHLYIYIYSNAYYLQCLSSEQLEVLQEYVCYAVQFLYL